jgi:polyvinyl alcohol dehydrogenase (cytochrome)
MGGKGPAASVGAVMTALLVTVPTCGGDAGPSSASGASGRDGEDRWAQLGHDLTSTFHNARAALTPERAAELEAAWTYRAPASVNGAPAVVGDRVYLLSGQGLVALDADGQEVWKRDDVRGTSSPTLRRGVLYVYATDTTLWALDADDGTDRWKVKADDQQFATAFSSPVLAGNAVIVGLASLEEVAAAANATFRGGVAAFDRSDGEELWRYRTAEPPYNGVGVWSTASVDLDAGTVFVTTGNNYTESAGPTSDSVIALDLETGEERWIRQVSTGDVFTVSSPRSQDSDFGTNPILFEAEVDGRQRKLLGAGQKSGVFWVLDRETGAIVWQRQVSDGSALIGGVFNNGAYDGRSIIVAGNNGPPGPGPDPPDRPRRARSARRCSWRSTRAPATCAGSARSRGTCGRPSPSPTAWASSPSTASSRRSARRPGSGSSASRPRAPSRAPRWSSVTASTSAAACRISLRPRRAVPSTHSKDE